MTTSKTNDERPEASKAETSSPVGYGRPPAKHQFTKGKSGNPRGRPRKQCQMASAASSSIDDLICAELNRPIAIRENDREVHLPAIQIALRALTLQAAKLRIECMYPADEATEVLHGAFMKGRP